MSLPDWQPLVAEHESWLNATTGSPRCRDVPSSFGRAIRERFAAFLDCLTLTAVPCRDAASQAAAALVFLGPGGAPPAELWATFRRSAFDDDDVGPPDAASGAPNPFDLALAFGCGWGRTIEPGRGWAATWQTALLGLIAQVKSSVEMTSNLLAGIDTRLRLSPDELRSLPDYFALSLLGRCSCGHHCRGCGGTCGRECCFEAHSLAAWDPSACGLRPFIDQAVRGTAGRKILGGAFAESLTYRSLEPDGRILCRPVEFKRCSECDALFEEAQCPTVGCEPSEARSARQVARRNWLIVPEHHGGNYREVRRWECGNPRCRNLYRRRFVLRRELTRDPCPACGWLAPEGEKAATKTVWVRVAPGKVVAGEELLRIADPGDPYALVGEGKPRATRF